jgi:hypothetical protein
LLVGDIVAGMRRKLPATLGTFWLLIGGAVLGLVLGLTTEGLARALGVGLLGACLVVAVQLWLQLRRRRRPDSS